VAVTLEPQSNLGMSAKLGQVLEEMVKSLHKYYAGALAKKQST
jgi:hypothetical protein